jgi:hypothetical protein
MKLQKRLTLLSAIAAVPMAAHAGGLQPLDEASMRNVSGQAGVTLELDVRTDIDRVAYSQNANGTSGAGALLVDNISLGGNRDGNGDLGSLEFQIDIDIEANGDAVIGLKNRGSDAPFSMGLDIGAIGLGDSMLGDMQTTLVSNLQLDALVGDVSITATNSNPFTGGGTTGSIILESAFAVDNLEADVDILAMRIEEVRVAASGNLSTLRGGGDITESMLATNTVTIGAGQRLSDVDGSQPKALRVSVGDSDLDVWMGDIQIGGGSVGSVAIQGLSMAGTEVAVYGRD